LTVRPFCRSVTPANFTPYGEEHTTQATTCPQNYKFTGYERDNETQLDYAFARYYNSHLGRFMSTDPMGGDLTDPQSLNRYAYVGNSAVNFTDPSGMFKHPCVDRGTGGGVCNYGDGFSLAQYFGGSFVYGLGYSFSGRTIQNDLPVAIYTLGLTPIGIMNWLSGGVGSGDRAAKLLLKPDCLNFVGQAAFAGILNQGNGQEVSPQEFAQGLEDSGTVFYKMTQTLAHTTYVSAPEPPTPPGFVTYANTQSNGFGNPQTVNLFPPYESLSGLAQAQTQVHEAVHDAYGLTDQMLGQATTGQIYPDTPLGQAQGSAAFQKSVEKHCK
jgi:RHS repeat-associated protein